MNRVPRKLKIGEVAKRLGISNRTIRYYEEVGLMGDGKHEPGSMRLYSEEEVIRLKFILKMKALGISLKEMRELAVNYELNNKATDKVLPQLIEILDQHTEDIEAKLKTLIALRSDIESYRERVVNLLRQADGKAQQVASG